MHINFNIKISDESMKDAQVGINNANHALDAYLFKDNHNNSVVLESTVIVIAIEELANARKVPVEEYIRSVKQQMEEVKDVAIRNN
jgi:predicted P-loop ATPase